MSQGNEAFARNFFDTFNRDGVEGVLPYFDPEIEWFGPPEWLEEPVYSGHDGLRRLAAAWEGNFGEYRLDFEQLFELADDEVLVLAFQRGRIKGSDDRIELRVGFEWLVRDRRIARVKAHFSWEQALVAAGLSARDASAGS
jgi:ketosteroid isomerase-like protein